MTLDHGESFYLGIYIDTEKCSPVGNYELGIAYYDCFGYRYMQTFDLIVEREKGRFLRFQVGLCKQEGHDCRSSLFELGFG